MENSASYKQIVKQSSKMSNEQNKNIISNASKDASSTSVDKHSQVRR